MSLATMSRAAGEKLRSRVRVAPSATEIPVTFGSFPRAPLPSEIKTYSLLICRYGVPAAGSVEATAIVVSSVTARG
jgi:hypothetical protein